MSDQIELRCENKILFGMLGDGVLEVKCRSNRCGARPGIVVLHRFSALDGSALGTRMFKDPTIPNGKKGAE